MAEVRRNHRVIESVDPVTGESTYRDEVTGETVVPDTGVVQPSTEVTERTVTHQASPSNGQIVSQRVVRQQTTPATPAAGLHQQETEVYTEDPYAPRRERAYRLQQAIYLIFGIIEGLLAIRFVLRLLGANPKSGFASAIYGITAPFMAPFVGLFGQPSAGGSVVEFNTLVAIVVYALIAWVLAKVVWLVAGETRSGVRTSQVDRRIDQ
ncbi:MAG: YggT family protein [Nitrososphaerales archaeon]